MHSFTQQVLDYLTARPHQFVSAVALEAIGGRQAWRTRVSDARKLLEARGDGTIKNRLTKMTRDDGSTWVKSEYAFIPAASEPVSIDEHGQAAFF